MGAITSGVLPVFLFGALAPLIRRDVGIDAAGVGLIVAGSFAAAACAAVPAGRLSERLGVRASLRLSTAASGVMLVATGALGRSFGGLLTLLLVAGVVNSVAFSAANITVGRVVRVGRRGVGLGLQQSALPAATLLSGLSLPYLGVAVGWRWVYVGAALLPLVLFAAVPAAGTADAGARARDVTARPTLGRKSPLVLLAVAGGFAFSSGAALGTFSVESTMAAGHGARFAGLALALGSAVTIVVRVSTGFVVDRLSLDPLRLVSAMLALGALGYAVLAFGRSPAWIALGTAVAFGSGWGWTAIALFVAIKMYTKTPAVAAATIGTGLCLGGVVGPPTLGLVATSGSFGTAWAVASAATLAAAGIVELARTAARRGAGA